MLIYKVVYLFILCIIYTLYFVFKLNILDILFTDDSVRWRQNSWDEVTQSTTINERNTPSQKSSSSDRDPELSSEEESNKYVFTFNKSNSKLLTFLLD